MCIEIVIILSSGEKFHGTLCDTTVNKTPIKSDTTSEQCESSGGLLGMFSLKSCPGDPRDVDLI